MKKGINSKLDPVTDSIPKFLSYGIPRGCYALRMKYISYLPLGKDFKGKA